jgi:RNA polymerase sigma-70 factor (ECF subfamily)
MSDRTDPIDPDAALMMSFQNGDAGAFEQILDKYHRPIVNFIYKIVNNRGEAEELAQDVFLRIYRAKDRYEPRARFASWIYRIATNVSLKAASRARRLRIWSPSTEEESRVQETFRDYRPNAEAQMVEAERAEVIRRALRRLPPKERVAIVLRRYEGLSYKEIADAMSCTEAAVKTYIHRGKLHVRDWILNYMKKGNH